MKVKKTLKAKILHLTKIKRQLLEREYENLQRFLHGESADLYSANKQRAKRFYKKIKPDKEYPLSIRINESYTSQLCWRCGSLNTTLKWDLLKIQYAREEAPPVRVG